MHLNSLYQFSRGIPKSSVGYSEGTHGSYRNLRNMLFNVVFGLRQVASMSMKGEGVAENLTTAAEYFNKSAAQGDPKGT
jgi:TPR repeat protein